MNADPQPLFLPGARVRVIRSPFNGVPYRIFVAVPEQPPPEGGYPAVFLLDANATFMSTVESLRMRVRRQASTGIPPAVVVGIGHDTDAAYDTARRRHDFAREVRHPERPDTPVPGGAGVLTRLIDEVVRPTAAADAPLDPARQTLIGHSLGGCYVLSRLVENPAAFESYIAISPSVWADEHWLLAQAATIGARLSADLPPRRVMITVGEFEQTLAPWQADLPDRDRVLAMRQARAMRDKAHGFARRLSEGHAPRLIVRFEELAGEDHSSSAMVGIGRGLRFALWPGAVVLHNI
ncbi:alpha/beta hydrolase [Pseudochelatococcus sp. B33]